MPMQHGLFSICVGKMLICDGKKNVDAKEAFLIFRQQNGNLSRQNGNLPQQDDFSLLLLSFIV